MNIYFRKMTSRQRAQKDQEKKNNLALKILMDEHAGLVVTKIIYRKLFFIKHVFYYNLQ